MNRKIVGLALMLLASFFFIFGAPWYVPSHVLENRIIAGLIFGVPALGVMLLAWRRPRIGARAAVLLAALATVTLLVMLLHQVLTANPYPGLIVPGDIHGRMIPSLFVISVVYLIGAITVFTSAKKTKSSLKGGAK